MPNFFFEFKQFKVHHDRCAMKVTTDGCLFGAWVAEELAKKKDAINNCLDVGAGTGLLSLMIAQKNNFLVEAIEIDNKAAEQAKENVESAGWINRVNVFHQDLVTWNTERQFDCIVSNPPFYESQLKSETKSKNLAHHDEGLTLSSLLCFVKDHLRSDGFFFLLMPAARLKEINELLEKNGLFTQQKITIKQTPKHQPFRVMIEAGKSKTENPVESILIIKDENNEYTKEFAALLRDYYLNL